MPTRGYRWLYSSVSQGSFFFYHFPLRRPVTCMMGSPNKVLTVLTPVKGGSPSMVFFSHTDTVTTSRGTPVCGRKDPLVIL